MVDAVLEEAGQGALSKTWGHASDVLSRLDQLSFFQFLQVLFRRQSWVLEGCALCTQRSQNARRSALQQITHKPVWMAGDDAVWRQQRIWEVTEIEGDDHIRACFDRRGQDMPVVWIRQIEAPDVVLVSFHQRTGNSTLHQAADAHHPIRRQIGMVSKNVPHPLVVDAVGPAWSNGPCPCQPDQQVAQKGGVKHVRVVDRDRPPHS